MSDQRYASSSDNSEEETEGSEVAKLTTRVRALSASYAALKTQVATLQATVRRMGLAATGNVEDQYRCWCGDCQTCRDR